VKAVALTGCAIYSNVKAVALAGLTESLTGCAIYSNVKAVALAGLTESLTGCAIYLNVKAVALAGLTESLTRTTGSNAGWATLQGLTNKKTLQSSIYQACRGGVTPIRVNLSSNAYSTGILPHPSIPSPLAGRGGFGFRQNRGGVTRILMVGDLMQNQVLMRLLR
jgi:hypothetical protein